MKLTHKQPKYIWCDASTQNYQPANFKENKRRILNQSKIQTSSIPMMRITSNITKKINKEDIIVIKHTQASKDVRCVVIQDILRDLDVQWANTNVRIALNLVISLAFATRILDMKTKGLWSQDNPRDINWRLAQFVHKILYVASQKISVQVMNHSAWKWKSSLFKLRPLHYNIL